MYKEELFGSYSLAAACLVLLIVTLLTGEIAWGLGVAIPLYFFLVAFKKNIQELMKKENKKE